MTRPLTYGWIARLAGAVLVLLAVSVMAGWLLHIEALIRWRSSYPAPVLGTAVALLVCGLLLVSGVRPIHHTPKLAIGVGGVLTVFALAVLWEHLTKMEVGVDLAHLHSWLRDQTKAPGRPSPPTAFGLLFAGLAIMLSTQVASRVRRIWVHTLTWLAGAIGFLGLAGYFVDAQLLFPHYPLGGMALQTAAGLSLLAVGLNARWKEYPWGQTPLIADQVDHVTAAGGTTLTIIALIAGISTFSILQGRVQTLVGEGVLADLSARQTAFRSSIGLRTTTAESAAGHPIAIAALRALQHNADDRQAKATVQALADGYLKLGFSTLAFHDAEGNVVVRAARSLDAQAPPLPASPPKSTDLVWSNGFVLRHRIPIEDNGAYLGFVVGQQPLRTLTGLAMDASRLGASAESGLCVASGEKSSCYPQRKNPQSYTTGLFSIDGSPLPMTRALKDETGVTITRDYRGNSVIAAYGPVGVLGLAMVVKVDTSEVFALIREQLELATGLLLLLVAAGTLLLRSRIKPLVDQIIASTNALRENQEQFRSVVSGVSDYAIIMLDLEGRVTSWNAGAESITGYRVDEILGRHFSSLYPPQDVAQGKPGLELDIVKTKGRLEEEGWRLRKDGSQFWANVVITALSDEAGHLRGFVNFTRDTTERMRLEQELRDKNVELERASRAKDVFLANMSHELRTPLNAIIGFTGTLLMRLPGPLLPDQEKQLRTVQGSGRHLLSLINDLLQVAKIGADKQEFDIEPVACNSMVEEVAAMLRGQAMKSGLQLGVQVPDAPAYVQADRRALRQVLLNLVGNAIKFTEHGSVTIGLERTEDHGKAMVAFHVTDTGPGIEEKQQGLLFEPFSRIHSAHRPEIEGTGLGLHVSRMLAEQLGGSISLESKPGAGSTFTLQLPAA